MKEVGDLGTKTIELDEDAYKRLKALKRKNESFTDVVLRLTRSPPKKSFYDLAGAWEMSDEEERELMSYLDQLWGAFDESVFGQRLSDRLFEKP